MRGTPLGGQEETHQFRRRNCLCLISDKELLLLVIRQEAGWGWRVLFTPLQTQLRQFTGSLKPLLLALLGLSKEVTGKLDL